MVNLYSTVVVFRSKTTIIIFHSVNRDRLRKDVYLQNFYLYGIIKISISLKVMKQNREWGVVQILPSPLMPKGCRMAAESPVRGLQGGFVPDLQRTAGTAADQGTER